MPMSHPNILDWQLESQANKLLLGLAIQCAVLDVETDRESLARCLQVLETPTEGLRSLQMGRFGSFEVTLNHHHDDTVSIFIDGPIFAPRRHQSAAVWVDKTSLCKVLREVVGGCTSR